MNKNTVAASGLFLVFPMIRKNMLTPAITQQIVVGFFMAPGTETG
jgi:hypothetical protein